MKRKLLSMFSLCQRAGKLKTGELACEKALQNHEARLVIVCVDASENTKKKFSQKTFYYKVPYFCLLAKAELGAAIGKQNRATIAVTDDNFAKKICSIIEESPLL